MAVGLAMGVLKAAWGLAAPWKHVGLKATGAAVDFATNDGTLTKGFFGAAKDVINGDFQEASEDLTGAVRQTVGNREQIAENASNIQEKAATAANFVSDVANGENPLSNEDGEGGVGGLFNSITSGDIFNMDNAKTAGKWGLGALFLFKVFDWLKDSFSSDDNQNDNSGGGMKTALTLGVVIAAGAFIYNKFGDDIKQGIGMDEKPETAQAAPKTQSIDDALTM